NYAELSPVTVVAASFPSGAFLTFASPVGSQSEARAQPLTAEERRRTRSRAQAAIETGRIERGVRCEHEDVAVPAALEDPRFGGRCQVAEVVAERGQLRLQHSVITGVGDIGQIESGVLERLRAGGEELPGLQGGRHRVVVEGVSDDDVEGIGPEPTDLRGTVTGAQGQSGGAGQVEPLAGEVEQGGIDVDRRLLRSRARRVEGSGQRAAGRSDVHGPQRPFREFDIDGSAHPVEVLEVQALRIAERDRRRGDPIDVEDVGIGLAVEMSTTWEPGAVYIRRFATPHFYASRALVAIRPEASWGRRPRLERLLPVDRNPPSTGRCADLVGRLRHRLEWNRSAEPRHHRIRDEDTIMRTPARSPEDIIGIVPHTLGYTPRNSLVALIVGTDDSGAQSSSTTLRIDFSRETAARIIAEGGDWYVDLVLRAGTVSGVFLILYDEDYEHIDPFADEAA